MKNKFSREGTPITYILLQTIAVAGVLSVALLAPNALQVLKMFGYGKLNKNIVYRFNENSKRLARQGLICFRTVNGYQTVSLTSKGEKRLLEYKLKSAKNDAPKKWDGKWRIVLFDVSEEKRVLRNWLRSELQEVGFTKLQKSAWIYPYDCKDIVELLKINTRLGKEVMFIVTDRVEGDNYLKKKFGLV